MGARILGIELRRSVAMPAALVIAAVGVFVLFASNPPYRSWMELVVVQRDIMQLTWPLALAAGAWQGIRERRSRVEELIATTARPRPQRVLPVATAMAIAAVVAYLVMLAGGTGHLRHPDGYFPAGAVPLIALGALALVAAAWLGLAIGALLPSPLTAPMLVVIAFLGLAVVPPMLRDQDRGEPGAVLLLPFLQGPRDGGYELQVLSARANLSQALWLVAVAATGLALLAAARTATRVAALLPVLLGAAIAVPAMPRQLAAAWVADPRATEVVCTRDEPQVCIARMHSYALDELSGPARQALSVLAAKLPPAPTRVMLRTFGDGRDDGRPPADTLLAFVSPDDDVLARTPDDLVEIMLDGAGVPPCPNLPGASPGKVISGGSRPDAEARYLAARRAAGAWLLDRDPEPARAGEELDVTLARQALDALHALPADRQRARVAALRDAERTCAPGDRLDLLTGTSGTR
ncbi:MAG TPA: hypothetical protein VGJ95_13335 [Pseudonocardiaceae bacterium]|jgi:hypothetical protein